MPLDKWFYAIWKIANSTNGISSVQLSKEIGIRQATAWSMLHRIRMCMGAENVAKLSGEVELKRMLAERRKASIQTREYHIIKVEVQRQERLYWVCLKETAKSYAV